uniref:Uncharacterized protein n=1 Tax=Avena sativa TaxID=4498 RepID=A0ACD5TSL5_AVESA
MHNRMRRWEDLPDGLLDSFIARLSSFHDLLAFEATCRSWRAAFLSYPPKHTLGTLFPPLLMQPDDPSCSRCPPQPFRKILVPTRICRITDIANKDTDQCCEIPRFCIHRRKNAPRCPLDRFCFRGASYGTLILSSNKSCVLFDVFTGATVSCPQMPVFEDTELSYGALTAPLTSPNSHLFVDTGLQNLFWCVGSHSWVGCTPADGPIKQIVVFKGRVFGMDSNCRIFRVHLTPRISIHELPVLESRLINKWHLSDPWLVVCGDMLLLIGLPGRSHLVTNGVTFEVFRLDLSTEPAVWLKVEKLENWAIFISTDKRSQTLSCMDPEIWGGASNSVYCYNQDSQHWIALELGKPVQGHGSKFNPDIFVSMGRESKLRPMWIFPSMFSLRQ